MIKSKQGIILQNPLADGEKDMTSHELQMELEATQADLNECKARRRSYDDRMRIRIYNIEGRIKLLEKELKKRRGEPHFNRPEWVYDGEECYSYRAGDQVLGIVEQQGADWKAYKVGEHPKNARMFFSLKAAKEHVQNQSHDLIMKGVDADVLTKHYKDEIATERKAAEGPEIEVRTVRPSYNFPRNSKYWVRSNGADLYRVNGDTHTEDRLAGGVKTEGSILDGSYRVIALLFGADAPAEFKNGHDARNFIEENCDSAPGLPCDYEGDPFEYRPKKDFVHWVEGAGGECWYEKSTGEHLARLRPAEDGKYLADIFWRDELRETEFESLEEAKAWVEAEWVGPK